MAVDGKAHRAGTKKQRQKFVVLPPYLTVPYPTKIDSIYSIVTTADRSWGKEVSLGEKKLFVHATLGVQLTYSEENAVS